MRVAGLALSVSRARLINRGMSMRKHIAALAVLSALAMPAAANAAATITLGSSPTGIVDINNFKGDLDTYFGLTQFTTDVTDIVLDPNSAISFYFLGSESGYSDTFSTLSTPVVTYTESTSFSDAFAAPIYIGGGLFAPGSLKNLLNFSSDTGAPATIGDTGFAIFLPENFVSGTAVTEFVFGYDDQVTNPDDDNHDDMIFRAVVSSVHEPGTWAMMLLGFGAVGAMMRRKRPAARAALATA